VIEAGRFSGLVSKELVRCGPDVLGVDRQAAGQSMNSGQVASAHPKAVVPDLHGRGRPCGRGVLELDTWVIAISEPIEASITRHF